MKKFYKLLVNLRSYILSHYKNFIKLLWKVVNAPVTLLTITLIIGNYYLPNILANSQFKAQQAIDEKNQKYQYGQALLNSYEKVNYLAHNYYWNYKYEPDFEKRKDALWNEYHEALRDWNIQLIANIIAIERYTGSDNRTYFENEVQGNILKVNDELLHIRDSEPVDDQKINDLFKYVLDNRMYRIAYQLSY